MSKLPDRPSELAEVLGISVPYASQLLGGSRPWPRNLAISVFRKTGVKIGPIARATDDEIAVLARFEPSASEAA